MDRTSLLTTLSNKWIAKPLHNKWFSFVTMDAKNKYQKLAKMKQVKYWEFVTLPAGSTTISFGYGYAHKKLRGKLTFNPSKFDAKACAQISSYFDDIGIGFWVFSSYSLGRTEIAIDIDGAKFSDYLFLDPSIKEERDHLKAVGTIYLGSRKSARQFTIYDKAKELLNKSHVDLEHTRLRIEVIVTPRLSVSELPSIKNPFRGLLVVDRAKLFSADALVSSFLARIDKGMSVTDSYWAAGIDRPALRKKLAAAQSGWWNPHEMWSKMPSSVQWAEKPCN